MAARNKKPSVSKKSEKIKTTTKNLNEKEMKTTANSYSASGWPPKIARAVSTQRGG